MSAHAHVVPGFLFDQQMVQKNLKLRVRGYVPPSPSWDRTSCLLFYGGWSAKKILDALGWPVHYWLSKEEPKTPCCEVREPVKRLDRELDMAYPTYIGYHHLRFPAIAMRDFPGRPAPLPLLVLALALYKHMHNAELLPEGKWFRTLTAYSSQTTIKSCEKGIVVESREPKDQNTSPPTAMIE